jgi:hypothetical protein
MLMRIMTSNNQQTATFRSSPETRSMARARLQDEQEAKQKEMEEKGIPTPVMGSESVSKNSTGSTAAAG